jgi:hypothetical protein
MDSPLTVWKDCGLRNWGSGKALSLSIPLEEVLSKKLNRRSTRDAGTDPLVALKLDGP